MNVSPQMLPFRAYVGSAHGDGDSRLGISNNGRARRSDDEEPDCFLTSFLVYFDRDDSLLVIAALLQL